MSKKTSNCRHEGWHRNTAICCDLKMLLRSDYAMRSGREYQGILRRDEVCEEFRYDEHYTFIETLPWLTKRNPRVFRGKYISITRRADGTLRLNFLPVKMDDHDFSVASYASGVANELLWALEGLTLR